MRPALPLVPAVVALVLGGCSSYPDLNGALAIGRDGEHTIVLLHTCHGSVEEVTVSADRQGLKPDEQNPVLGELHATTPVSGQVTLDLANPGPGWRVTTPVALPTEPSKGVIVTAREESAHTEMRQADATVAQIRDLRPGQVLVMGEPGRSSRVVGVEQFHHDACAG